MTIWWKWSRQSLNNERSDKEVLQHVWVVYRLRWFPLPWGSRELWDFYDVNGCVSHTLQFSLHETCFETRTETCILYGYSPDKVLKYDLDSGVFTSPPDLSSSARTDSLRIVDRHGLNSRRFHYQQIQSRILQSTHHHLQVWLRTRSPTIGNYYLVRDKNTGSIVDFDDNPTPYLNLPFLPNTINDIPYGPEPEDPTKRQTWGLTSNWTMRTCSWWTGMSQTYDQDVPEYSQSRERSS